MLTPGLGGIARWTGRGATLPGPVLPTAGNSLPANRGVFIPDPFPRGPSADGFTARGNLGSNDGNVGGDPRSPHVTEPRFLPGSNVAGMDAGTGNNPSWYRGGIQGFNDKLTIRDRHVYWDRGYQRTGVDGFGPAGSPNTYNDPATHPPTPELRALNRSLSYQKGSDHTAAQDDLSRPYTWLGEQGSGWAPIYGGVPGLYEPYGTRGGVPYPVVSPVEYGSAKDGPQLVFSGPPHGLHSQTPWPSGAQVGSRIYVLPQMTPPRIDRPSNSPQAGQSYSQTVLRQGQTRMAGRGQTQPRRAAGPMQHRGRGWAGSRKRTV